MNMAEATQFRELAARVSRLESQVKDLTRRLDDHSKASRMLADDVEKAKQTLSLKKASNG